MRKKLRLLAGTLSMSMVLPLFGGCSIQTTQSVREAETESETETLQTQTEEVTETVTEAETETAKQSYLGYNLNAAPFRQYSDTVLTYTDLIGSETLTLGDGYYVRIENAYDLRIDKTYPARYSTDYLCVNPDDAGQEELSTRIEAQNTFWLSDEDKTIGSRYFYTNYPLFHVAFDEDGTMSVQNVCYSYSTNSVNVNGFIHKKSETSSECTVEVIIDPAYMGGLPVLSNKSDAVMKFTINGTDILADTLSFTYSVKKTDDLYEALADLTDRYVYAKIKCSSLNVEYYSGEDSYYDNTGYIMEYQILSEDTDSVLKDAYLPDDGSESEMDKVYEVLMQKQEDLMTSDTIGVVLLDLDFDGTPEVLQSHLVQIDAASGDSEEADSYLAENVDVYRIRNGKLAYIDTIYQPYMNFNCMTNYLALKELDDGERGWVGTSYLDRDTGEEQTIDYLYRLEGNTLTYTKLFYTEGEDQDIQYYYGKTNLNTEATVTAVDSDDYANDYDEIVEWNGTTAYSMILLYDVLRENYYDDTICLYRLNSSWLSDTDSAFPTDISQANIFNISDREYAYKMAFLVDAFYENSYNAATYDYDFDYAFTGYYGKPVIYLYPEEEMELDLSVDFKYGGELTCTYPEYTDGWHVTAEPDGTLYDEEGNEYYCLYWEGEGTSELDMSTGFCVKGDETADFLREKLLEIGLTAREANEFIIYWLPILQENPYNVISFHTEDYAASVPLTCSVEPDTSIRVFMTYTPSDSYVDIAEQELPHYERKGFTLVEWGGGEAE